MMFQLVFNCRKPVGMPHNILRNGALMTEDPYEIGFGDNAHDLLQFGHGPRPDLGIAELDGILLKMAIAELLYFPSIPERVTINEYLEVAKEYSTPKSSIFLNGVLDKLTRDYRASGRLKKTGRGLL